MIGTQENAEVASSIVRVWLDEDGWECFGIDPTDGWTLIGNGAYRVALLGPDGVVYKVSYFTEGNENLTEYNNFISKHALIVSESSGRCRLAKSHYFDNGVIAMEYVAKAASAYKDLDGFYFTDATRMLINVFTRNDLFDYNSGNIWFDENGILTMVDYVA